jgi:hypothetical protein
MKNVKELIKVLVLEVIDSMRGEPVKLGSLNAHIPGDYRYSDSLNVMFNPNDDTVIVTVNETGAAGGMDSQYGATPSRESFKRVSKPGASAAEVMMIIKSVINNDSYLFKRYGKPTKNFVWGSVYNPIGKGLSSAMCAQALARVRKPDEFVESDE